MKKIYMQPEAMEIPILLEEMMAASEEMPLDEETIIDPSTADIRFLIEDD